MSTRLRWIGAFATVIAFCCAATAASAADLAVPAKYRSIARAMRIAKSWDRVVVSGGKWKHVRVTKANVALVGEDGAVIVGTATVSGRGATLRGFVVDGSVVATKRATAAVVSGNTLRGEGDIVVAGESAVVDGNHVAWGAIRADGDDAVIAGNSVVSAPGAGNSAIEVRGTHVSVGLNDVSHSASAAGIVVRGDGATVQSNSIHADAGGDAIVVEAGVTLVSGNTIADAADSASNGITLNGTGNTVRDNTISGVGADGVRIVAGEYNGLNGNVVTGARCGFNVCAEATGTQIVACTATAACMGLLNSGAESTVTDSTFLANRDHDVVVTTPCHVFRNNQFSTSVGTLAGNAPPPPPEPDFTQPIIFIGGSGGD
jgi:hypothetical protein